MAYHLRIPTLAFATLSLCLSIAIIGCAGKPLGIFNDQHNSNVWLLPIWPNHFDTRELKALLATSAAIVVLNAILIIALFINALPANLIILTTSLLSTICSIIAIAFPTVLTHRAPTRDTIQTWTCRWTNTSITRGEGPPSVFGSMCRETRFAFYTTIPVLILQLLLLGTAVYAIATSRRSPAARRLGSDAEKGDGRYEMGEVRRVSVETKSDASSKAHTKGGIEGVQFA